MALSDRQPTWVVDSAPQLFLYAANIANSFWSSVFAKPFGAALWTHPSLFSVMTISDTFTAKADAFFTKHAIRPFF
jgi:hypothetical protein